MLSLDFITLKNLLLMKNILLRKTGISARIDFIIYNKTAVEKSTAVE